ncbi:MAG: ASKHA domain-containing protein [Oscillospiraceae bacterium]|jgi:uncharacterized 2Fe-2S/4Fe-4S cluster protein (DUF4445 family)|nr:ASKHA domain-containing protein [Oscillospiraceae bacterium]
MNKITFKTAASEITIAESGTGANILDLAREHSIDIDAPCNGNGTCGKCKVKLNGRDVLACQTVVTEDSVVEIPEGASAFKSGIKTADLSDERELAIFRDTQRQLSEFTIETGLSIVSVQLSEPTADDPADDWTRLSTALNLQSASLFALSELPDALRSGNWNADCVVRGSRLLDIGPDPRLCGLAVDIGTTTVAAVLADLQTGEILAKASAGNGQIRYGADVIHRIVEAEKPGGSAKLRGAILDTLNPLIAQIADIAGIPRIAIYRAVITGNTTMNHLLLGLPSANIRLDPYVPAVMEFPVLTASEIALPINPDAEVIIAPNSGSYVGGDVTAGTLASLIWKREDSYALFVDLGTNGELVFGGAEFLFCCACSAGPAIEGGDMSCGTRATDGAIEDCVIDASTLEPSFSVIGNVKPSGICGSGYIDLVAELFTSGIIDARGKFAKLSRRIKDTDGIKSYVLAFADESASGSDIEITEIDLDNFIRAKAAIFSAIRTMLAGLDFAIDMIDEVLIAGGIGSGINFANAVTIGMLPDIGLDKYRYLGNTSLAGAYAMLSSSAASAQVTEIKRNMTYLDLSTHPGYMEEFVGACFIPHTDSKLFPSAL